MDGFWNYLMQFSVPTTKLNAYKWLIVQEKCWKQPINFLSPNRLIDSSGLDVRRYGFGDGADGKTCHGLTDTSRFTSLTCIWQMLLTAWTRSAVSARFVLNDSQKRVLDMKTSLVCCHLFLQVYSSYTMLELPSAAADATSDHNSPPYSSNYIIQLETYKMHCFGKQLGNVVNLL